MGNLTDAAPAGMTGRERVFTIINRASGWLEAIGLLKEGVEVKIDPERFKEFREWEEKES